MSKLKNTWWAEKYRPTKLEDYIANDDLVTKIGEWIKTGEIPNLILYSEYSGTGKTSLCRLIAKNVSADVMELNGSDTNSVETVRETIKSFAYSSTFNRWKICIINEFSMFSVNAQSALLDIIEGTSYNTRFFLTGNYIEKFLPAIRSRCTSFLLQSPPPERIFQNIQNILAQENITFEPIDIVNVIKMCYPDQRRMLNFIQANLVGGNFKLVAADGVEAQDYCHKILDELKGSNTSKVKFENIRQIIADSKVREFDELFKYLYDKLYEYAPDGKRANCILQIAEGQYQSSFVTDKEIQVMAMITNIIKSLN